MNPLKKAHDIAAKFRASLPPSAKAAKKEDVGSLYIYQDIGPSFWGDGIGAQDVADQLKALDGVATINVYINSAGGDVFDGTAIFNQLERFPANKIIHVDGLAASAASFIAMAGNKIIMAPSALMMVHEASTLAYGRAADMTAMAELLNIINGSLISTYAKRTGNTEAAVRDLLAAETWMSAEKAKELGFCDEIGGDEAATTTETATASKVIDIAAATQARIAAHAANAARIAAAADRAKTISGASPAKNPAGQPAGKK